MLARYHENYLNKCTYFGMITWVTRAQQLLGKFCKILTELRFCAVLRKFYIEAMLAKHLENYLS